MSITSLLATGAPHRLITDERFASSIDDRLDPEADPVVNRVFSNYAPTASGESVYEANLWGDAWAGGALDFSGVSWWNSQSGSSKPYTAISPRHVIAAHHFSVPEGTTLRFIVADGTFVDRDVIDAIGYSSVQEGQDLHIAYLDEDLPGTIAQYPILSEELNTRLRLEGYPAITLYPDGTYRALATVRDFDDWPIATSFIRPTDPTRLKYHVQMQGIGSGHPCFALLGLQLIFILAIRNGETSGGIGPAGPSVNQFFDLLMADCETLDNNNDQTGHLPLVYDS